MTQLTRGQKVNADITVLLRSRHTLLWVTSREETRVERALIQAAADASFEVRLWDCCSGITKATGEQVRDVRDPAGALEYIRTSKERAVFVLRDLHRWMDPVVLRSLRNLARSLQSVPKTEARSVVLLTPSGDVPMELAGCTTVVDYPLPDRAEIAQLLDDVLKALPEGVREGAANGSKEAAVDSAVGLSAEEAANCYAKSLVASRKIDPSIVAGEKKRVIARERVLTWYDPDPRGLDAVGGLDNLKAWLRQRRSAFSAAARAFGLPAPKGCLLAGIPGCGKSLTAKAVAAAWQMPLLRLDMGGLRSKYVGESEANVRKALQVAEAVSPCILWLDELEKALAGSTGPAGDGGVAADALGVVLSWMQERSGSVFVIATANDVEKLPPELLRKGRFDELWWIDLPTPTERAEIVAASLRQYGRNPAVVDLDAVAMATSRFTGSEIASLVPDALYVAFEQQRELTTADLEAAAETVVPLAVTASDRIESMRSWAKGRARQASVQVIETSSTARKLDL